MRPLRSNPEQPEGAGVGYAEAARLLSYLADETRLRVLAIVAEGEKNVRTICDRLKRPQPSVSHHLALLRHTGILTSRRRGKEVYYALSAAHRTGQNAVTVSARGVTLTVQLENPVGGSADRI
jgi:DNA-binding transcriptional ArsR family regulator